jgi:hypothetical protein
MQYFRHCSSSMVNFVAGVSVSLSLRHQLARDRERANKLTVLRDF